MAAPFLAGAYLVLPLFAVRMSGGQSAATAYSDALVRLIVRTIPYLIAGLLIAAVPQFVAEIVPDTDALIGHLGLVWFIVAALIAMFGQGARGFFGRFLLGAPKPHSH